MINFKLSEAIIVANQMDREAKGLGTEQLDSFFESIAKTEDPDLLLESITLDEIDHVFRPDAELVDGMMLEAITTKKSRLDRTMGAFKRVLAQSMQGTDIDVGTVQIGKARKSGVAATLTALFPLTDGQTVGIIFHAPDKDPMVINADDTLIAFRFMLNKTDITNVVSPLNGRDISLKQVTMAISNLAEWNSEDFKANLEASAAKKAEIEKLEQDLESESEKQEAIAEEIDKSEEVQKELVDRNEHYQSVETRKVKRISDLKAQIAAFKTISASGKVADKAMLARVTAITAIDALEGRERAKAISKAVKAEFKRIGVTVNAKLQSQKEPLLDVRVKEGTTPIPQKTVDLLNSVKGRNEATSMYTYFFSIEDWLRALRIGFEGSEASIEPQLSQPMNDIFTDYVRSTSEMADSPRIKEIRGMLADQSWAKFSENNDIAENIFTHVIIGLRRRLLARGAEVGEIQQGAWPVMFEGVAINMESTVPYLDKLHWASYNLVVGKVKFPFDPNSDLNQIAQGVVDEAKKQSDEKAAAEVPEHKEDGTVDTPVAKTELVQGDKFTVDGMEYTLTTVPQTQDGYIEASGGVMGALGGERWEGYETFKTATGMTLAQFEQATPKGIDTAEHAIRTAWGNESAPIQESSSAPESFLDWESKLIDAMAEKYDMTISDVQGMLDMAHVQKMANALWGSKTSLDEAVEKVWKLATPSEESVALPQHAALLKALESNGFEAEVSESGVLVKASKYTTYRVIPDTKGERFQVLMGDSSFGFHTLDELIERLSSEKKRT